MGQKAFTLVELLITISIIAILAAIASISYSGIQQRGRDAQRKNDLNQIKVGLSTYYNAQVPVQFVPSASGCTSTSSNCATLTIDGSTDLLSVALEPNYIRNVPTDPTGTGNNVYQYYSSPLNSSANQAFTLTATLENKNDKRGWGGGSSWVAHGYTVQNE